MIDDGIEDDENDPLKLLERMTTPPKKPLALVVADGKEAYKAFEATNTPHRCIVHSRAAGMTTIFSYHHLGDIDCSLNDDFVMFATQRKLIRIYGEDLQLLITALTLHTCKAIYEYDKAKHLAPPANDGQPFIERIEIADIREEYQPRPERAKKAEKEN